MLEICKINAYDNDSDHKMSGCLVSMRAICGDEWNRWNRNRVCKINIAFSMIICSIALSLYNFYNIYFVYSKTPI